VWGDGPVTAKQLDQMDYMKLVLRESYRYSPLFAPNLIYRHLDRPIVLSGFEIPAGVKLALPIFTLQNDPRFVDKPEEFVPERWMKSAVASRKGTPKEVVDSMLISKPFGYGPRMCIGARLAENEIKVFFMLFIERLEIPV